MIKNKKILNRKNSYFVLFILICFFIVLIILVKKNSSNNKILAVQYSNSIGYWFNERGAFKTEGGLTYYYSPEYGKEYIACNKNGCNHDSNECSAYGVKTAITYDDKGMYYISLGESNKAFDAILYHIDIDGNNRKEIHRFENIEMITDAAYKNNKLYLAYQNSLDKNGITMDENEIGVLEYDIKSKKEKQILKRKEVNAYISAINIYNEKLYMLYNYLNITYEDALKHKYDKKFVERNSKYMLVGIGLKNLKKNVIDENIVYFTNIPIVGDYVIYTKNNGTYAYNIKKEKSKLLFRKKCELLENVSTNDNFILFFMNKSGYREYLNYDSELKIQKKVKSQYYSIALSDKYIYMYDENADIVYQKVDDFFEEKKDVKKFK